MRSFTAGFAVAAMLVAGSASAHISMTSPPPRSIGQLKNAPCGPTTDVRGSQTTCFAPGATVQVSWVETVDHPGHYRIMFDDDGTDAFVDPTSFDDTCSPSATCLVDDIADKSGGAYTQEITLPMTECDTCTLQLVQVMTDKAPYGDGNDLYYQCADIVIKGDCGGATTATTSATQAATTGKGAATNTNAATTGGAGDGGAGGAGGSGDEGGCAMAPARRHAPTTPAGAALLLAAGVLGAARVRRWGRVDRPA
jgi:hypothetical protein